MKLTAGPHAGFSGEGLLSMLGFYHTKAPARILPLKIREVAIASCYREECSRRDGFVWHKVSGKERVEYHFLALRCFRRDGLDWQVESREEERVQGKG